MTKVKKDSKKLGAGKKPKSNKTDENIYVVKRNGYSIFFAEPSNDKLRNDLRNTGNVINEVAIDCGSANDSIDEIAIFVKD